MNHNLETAPRLTKQARPALTTSSAWIAQAQKIRPRHPDPRAASWWPGRTDEEILQVMRDLRAHDIEMLTIGQYLAPSGHHLTGAPCIDVQDVRGRGLQDGLHPMPPWAPWCGSSYHADQQAGLGAGTGVFSFNTSAPSPVHRGQWSARTGCRTNAAAPHTPGTADTRRRTP